MIDKVKQVLAVLSIFMITSMLYGCNNSDKDNESSSAILEETTVTEIATTAQTTVNVTEPLTEPVTENSYDVMKYITYSEKTVADVLNDFENVEPYNGDKPQKYRGTIGQGWSWICPEDGVWFFYFPDEGYGLGYDSLNIHEVWIENTRVINTILSNSIKSPDSSETYYTEVDGVSYELYACSDFLTVMTNSNSNENSVPQKTPTKNLTNYYGIYVTGNTELAKMVGDTFINQQPCCWEPDYCYGYIFRVGCTFSDGTMGTYSDVTVSVNENPNYPYNGSLLVEATRETDGVLYPLTVTCDWEAIDYGDRYSVNIYNEKVNE